MLILNLLGLILLIIAIIISAIIIIPYDYFIKGGNISNCSTEISVHWLFSRFKIIISIYFNKKKEINIVFFSLTKKYDIIGKKENKQKRKKEEPHKKNKKNTCWSSHVNKAVINKFIILIKNLWLSLRPEKLILNGKIGFNDPMLTGIIYALYVQFSYLLKHYKVNLEPVFDDENLKYFFITSGRIWVLSILLLILKFLFSAPVRNEIISILKEKRGGNKNVRKFQHQ